MELHGVRRISSSDNKEGMQFGNFRYIFKQKQLDMWKNDLGYKNEVSIYTCDNIFVTKLVLNFFSASELYGHCVDLLGWQDSFDQKVQNPSNNEITRIYGFYDFMTKQYKLRIEKEQMFTGNKSIIVTSMDDEDFREFAFLFYFNFLIALEG